MGRNKLAFYIAAIFLCQINALLAKPKVTQLQSRYHFHWENSLPPKWSPDGKKVVVADGLGFSMFNFSEATDQAKEFEKNLESIKSLAWSPTGDKILTACQSHEENDRLQAGTVDVWDAHSGQHLRRLAAEEQAFLYYDYDSKVRADWSLDGSKIFTTSREESSKMWDADSGKLLWEYDNKLPNHEERDEEDQIASLYFRWSLDGSKILKADQFTESGNFDNLTRIRVWDVESGALITEVTFESDLEQFETIDCSFDLTHVLMTSRDGFVNVWDLKSGEVIGEYSIALLPSDESQIFAKWSPNSMDILISAFGQENGADVTIWNPKSKAHSHFERRKNRRGDYLNVYAQWSPDGSKILALYEQRLAIIWDVKSHQSLHSIDMLSRKVDFNQMKQSRWSDDGSAIFLISNLMINVIDAKKWEIIYETDLDEIEATSSDFCSSWSSNKSQLLCSFSGMTLVQFDATNDTEDRSKRCRLDGNMHYRRVWQ